MDLWLGPLELPNKHFQNDDFVNYLCCISRQYDFDKAIWTFAFFNFW
jgi:hypothetical protein